MPRYTEKFKAGVIVTLEGAGYPDNPYKLKEVADKFKVSAKTLRRWYLGDKGAPLPESVAYEKRALADQFEEVAYKMLLHAGDQDVIDAMTGNAAVIAAATAVDKMRLLRNLPTEIVAIVPQLVYALTQAGLDPVLTFNRMLEKAHEQATLNSR
jgi:hypothetical protein